MSWIQDVGGLVFGKKPEVPDLKELNLSEEQLKAIEANLAAAPGAKKLADLTADEIDDLMKRAFPNFDAVRTTATNNIQSWQKGVIQDDVAAEMRRQSAAHAGQGGYLGAGMHENLTMRDLGRTSLDLSFKGLAAAEGWMAASQALYSPALATFQSMFITPMQQAAFDVEERNTQWQHSYLKEQIKAMPDPLVRGIHDMVMSLAAAYLGGSYTGKNPQQDYAQAGSGMNSSLNGGSGVNWRQTDFQGEDWSDPNTYDWSNPDSPAFGNPSSVGGADEAGIGGGSGDFGASFGAGFGGYA